MDNQPVKVEMDIGEVELNIEKAIPCGLMLNELISNALKHAFSEPVDGREWKLRIDLHVCEGKPDTFEVIVADNGLGLPEGIDVDKPDSMGLRVIRTLCEQLKGRLEIASSEAGTTFKLIFSTGGNGRPTKERSHEPTDEHISM